MPDRQAKDFKNVLKNYENPAAIDLCKKMLEFDPQKRITIQEALEHPYMAKLHQEDDEPTDTPVSDFDFDFEYYSLKTEEFHELIYQEIQLYHDKKAYDKYLEEREANPEGILNRKFDKNRLRTMYKQDPTMIARASFKEEKKGKSKKTCEN